MFKYERESRSVVSNSWRSHGLHGILQARILEWVAFPFSRESSRPRGQTQVSRIAGSFFTSWATREAQEHWSAWSIPSPGGLPDPGIEPVSVALQADSLPAELSGKPYLHSYVGQISKRRCYLIKNLEVKGFALKISCIWGKTSLSEKNKKQKTGSMFLRWKGKEWLMED